MDIIAVLTDQSDYTKARNYEKYLKAKLKKENSQVVSITTKLKFLAPDGKRRLADMLDYEATFLLIYTDFFSSHKHRKPLKPACTMKRVVPTYITVAHSRFQDFYLYGKSQLPVLLHQQFDSK